MAKKKSPFSASPNPTPPPVSPSQHQVRAREAARVKDFPGGNIATSASRMAFLRRLCTMPKFLEMVDLVQAVVGPF